MSTAIGLTPGGSSTVHIYTQTIHRTTQITIEQHKITTNLEECRPCPIFASFTPVFALKLRKKHGKPQSGQPEEKVFFCVCLGGCSPKTANSVFGEMCQKYFETCHETIFRKKLGEITQSSVSLNDKKCETKPTDVTHKTTCSVSFIHELSTVNTNAAWRLCYCFTFCEQ